MPNQRDMEHASGSVPGKWFRLNISNSVVQVL